jgi:hypothetical protein
MDYYNLTGPLTSPKKRDVTELRNWLMTFDTDILVSCEDMFVVVVVVVGCCCGCCFIIFINIYKHVLP